MISSSTGHCARLHLSPRIAKRSTPMTGINLSNLSSRTLLFLFIFLGAPLAAHCDTLEDSARELADKIAAALPSPSDVSIGMQNPSSLKPEEVIRVEQALSAELQSRGIHAQTNGSAAPRIVVMLSENLKSFVWTAVIPQGEISQVVLTTIPRPLENWAISNGITMTLRSEKFWEGPQPILDATNASSSNGGHLLLLLTSNGLVIRKLESDVASIIPTPPTEFVMRDPIGVITEIENRISVKSASQICSIDPDAHTLIECHPTEGPAYARQSQELELVPPGPMHVENGGQIAAVQSNCRDGHLYLAAGQGDYTEPDTVRLFESMVTRGVIAERPLSDFLHFPGPVMALQSAGTTPRAIVHNLQTGNYEAYRIFVSCGQ